MFVGQEWLAGFIVSSSKRNFFFPRMGGIMFQQLDFGMF